MGKASVVEIARDHFLTMRDNRTGRPSIGDVIEQIVVPVALGGLAVWQNWHLNDATGAIAAIAIVAALMCSMAVFVFQIRLQIHQDPRLTDEDFVLVDEVFSNVLWAILVGLLLALFLVVVGAAGLLKDKHWGRWTTGFAVAVGAHFLVVIFVCLKRLRRAYLRIGARTA